MQEKELKIGFYVQYGSEYCTIVQIDTILRIVVIKSEIGVIYSTSIDSIKPIDITEELLLNYGFETINPLPGTQKRYEKKGFKISVSNTGNFYYKRKQILYVHKLQNLYFELKDEELILNN